ncbi:MAG: hypothetical protein GY697_28840, partial [Desulfobacterales bacterium]|nr:hypothetical protein [Desulfobacterales bacterium]
MRLKKAPRASATPDASEWLQWDGEIRPGHFRVEEEEITQVRAWFLERGRHPKVLLRDAMRMLALRYTCSMRADGTTGVCHIHAVPEDWEQYAAWLEELDLGMPYRGEGLPSLSLKVLSRLVKRKRREWLTGEQKDQLLEQHGHKCAQCGGTSSQM